MMYQITTVGIMTEVALEALVRILKLLISCKGQPKNRRRLQAKNGSLLGRITCFRCMNEGKVEAQPQLSGTLYLSVSSALTGRLISSCLLASARAWFDSYLPHVV